MTTPQIENVVKSPVLALQERANAGGHLNAGEIGKLLDANFPEPAFTDLAGQWGSGSKVPGRECRLPSVQAEILFRSDHHQRSPSTGRQSVGGVSGSSAFRFPSTIA